jgi:hypothetical protein
LLKEPKLSAADLSSTGFRLTNIVFASSNGVCLWSGVEDPLFFWRSAEQRVWASDFSFWKTDESVKQY